MAGVRIGDYELGRELGQGAFGVTYEAVKVSTDEAVAVKRLTLRGLSDWKPVERFEREAKVLRSLRHPGVVRFIDTFEIEREDGVDFFIVSELVKGHTLGEKIARGDRWTEKEAKALLRQLLEILEYLHSLSPRVIHRDIKPGNVIIQEDGTVVLIDFGAVSDVQVRRPDGGLTVAGTAGYMPPEQAMGVIDPRSDLYAVGATMVHVLTHTHPSELPRAGLRLKFEDRVGVSGAFIDLLHRLLDPDPERRPASAQEALAMLEGKHAIAPSERMLIRPESSVPAVPALPATPRPVTDAVTDTLSLTRTFSAGGHRPAIAMGAGIAVLVAGAMATRIPALILASPLLIIVAMVGALIGRQRTAIDLWQNGSVAAGKVVSLQSRDSGHIRVQYRYSVADRSFTGSLSLRDLSLVRDLEPGSALSVLFDPERPGRHFALLEREVRRALSESED